MSSTLSRILPKGIHDPEQHRGARRGAARWPLHMRISLMPTAATGSNSLIIEEGEQEASSVESVYLTGVVLNMSAGGLRVALPRPELLGNMTPDDEVPDWALRLGVGTEQELTRKPVCPVASGQKLTARLEADDTVLEEETVEVVWQKPLADGYLLGLRFVPSGLGYDDTMYAETA